METVIIAQQLQQIMPQDGPQTRSFLIYNNRRLDFVHYALVTERMGEVTIAYEDTMEEGANGNFLIRVPCPPTYPLNHWFVMVRGYVFPDDENAEPVLVMQQEVNALQIF